MVGARVWQGGMHGGGCAWQGACMAGGVHGRGHAWWGVCMAGETATAADGTHPTGMHSCFKRNLDDISPFCGASNTHFWVSRILVASLLTEVERP